MSDRGTNTSRPFCLFSLPDFEREGLYKCKSPCHLGRGVCLIRRPAYLEDLLRPALDRRGQGPFLTQRQVDAIRRCHWFIEVTLEQDTSDDELVRTVEYVLKSLNLVAPTTGYLRDWVFAEHCAGGGARFRKLCPRAGRARRKLESTQKEYQDAHLERVRCLWPTVQSVQEEQPKGPLALAIQFWWVFLNEPIPEVRAVLLMTALEALISTSEQEIAYSLRTRLARFIETRAEERQKIARDVKEAYSIRSKVVHGSGLCHEASYHDIEARVESYLRTAVLSILEDESKSRPFSSREGSRKFWADFDLR